MTGADVELAGTGDFHASPPSSADRAAVLELKDEKTEAPSTSMQLRALNEQLAAANISYRLTVPRLQAGAVRLGGAANRCKRDVADALSSHREGMQKDCARLFAAFQAQKRREEAVEDENKGLQSEVDDLERRARAEVAEVQRLKKELERKSELYEEIKAAFDEERESLEKMQREREEAATQLKETRGRLTETEEELDRQLREEKKRAGDTEGELKRQLQAAEARIHRAEEKWSASESQLRGVEVTLRDALSVHEERVRERETERQEAEASIERERGLKEKEGAARKEAEDRAEAADERAEAEASRAAKAVQAAKERQTAVDTQAAEISALKDKAAALEEEVASLRLKMGEESAKAASDKRTGVAIERCSAAKLRTQVTQLENRIKEHRSVHKARMEEMERYCEVQVAKARTEVEEQQKGQVASAVAELKQKIVHMEKEHMALVAEVRTKCQDSEKQQQDACDRQLHQAKMEHNIEVVALREKLRDMEREREQEQQQEGGEAERLREELARVEGMLEEEKEGREKDKAREVAVLETMEMSLLGLTSKLRAKDGEVQALQATVRRECEERMDLTCQVAVLKQQLPQEASPLRQIAHNHQYPPPQNDREAPRAPSCPPMTSHLPTDALDSRSSSPPDPPPARTGGWGLPAIGSRGPSPAQKQEARMLKEQASHRAPGKRFR